jgi:hypothetical protein
MDVEGFTQEKKPVPKKSKAITGSSPAQCIKTVFVCYLHFNMTAGQLRGLFGKYGTITYVLVGLTLSSVVCKLTFSAVISVMVFLLDSFFCDCYFTEQQRQDPET